MNPDRIDALLQRSLETGRIPDDATAEERVQLAPLLAAAASLQLNAAQVAEEANAAMPTARARFQRTLAQARAAEQPPVRQPVTVGQSRGGVLSRFTGRRGFAFSGAIAAAVVVAVFALVLIQPFGTVETASALTVDDYVQVDGVVSANDGNTVTLQSPALGDITVAVTDQTAVSDENGQRSLDSLRPGESVLVSGVVTARRAIAASNLAVGASAPTVEPGASGAPRLLKKYRDGLTGLVRVLALSPDGSHARILLVTPREPLLVDIDKASMDRFLAQNPHPVGATVRVVDAPDLPKGVFRLEGAPSDGATPLPTSASPQFENIRGVVTGRTGNVYMVRTERGVTPVVVRRTTTIRVGDSGLTLEDVLAGSPVVGHEVSVSGNPDAAGGRRIFATLIVVLGKAN